MRHQRSNPFRSQRILPLWMVMIALFATGCAQPPLESADYRVRHPILVGQEDIQLSLEAPFSAATLSVTDDFRVKRFVQDYMDRGRGMVIVELVGPPNASPAWQEQARQILLRSGLRPGEVGLLSGVTSGTGVSVRMTYTANTVKVPDCPDWSESTAHVPGNLPQSNWGCAYQRNIGLMVKDPGDLVAHRYASPRHPRRSVLVITDFREGGVTTSNKSPEQQSGYSGSEAAGREVVVEE